MNQDQSPAESADVAETLKKIIYDFGSNNGDDLPYYLKKADVVIAVEANPVLCDEIRERFPSELREGRLVVENCVLTTDATDSEVYFYIHKRLHVLSQFPVPDNPDEFDKLRLPSKTVMQLITKYGSPYYIKVDIERYDEVILRALFANNIRPPFISAESHGIDIFSVLVSLGNYRQFKFVEGSSVAKKYKHHQISVSGKSETHSFPHHSAGPFGEDVLGDWLPADEFFALLAVEGLGWKDIHATNIATSANGTRARPSLHRVAAFFVRFIVEPYVPKIRWDLIRRAYGKVFR